MRSVIPFPKRVQRTCRGCGERLRPEQPAAHQHCRRCWGFAAYRRAVTEFLEATRPR